MKEKSAKDQRTLLQRKDNMISVLENKIKELNEQLEGQSNDQGQTEKATSQQRDEKVQKKVARAEPQKAQKKMSQSEASNYSPGRRQQEKSVKFSEQTLDLGDSAMSLPQFKEEDKENDPPEHIESQPADQ